MKYNNVFKMFFYYIFCFVGSCLHLEYNPSPAVFMSMTAMKILAYLH